MTTVRRVFLSRTSEFEAKPPGWPCSYVDAAFGACRDAESMPVDMTDWTATPHPPSDECRRRVRSCDVYVGIIGFSYGTPVTGETDKSYTELEYETAQKHGLPRVIFVLAKDTLMPAGLVIGDPDYAARQEAFQQRLHRDGVTLKEFRTPDELRRLLADALRRLPAPDGGHEASRHSRSHYSIQGPPFMAPPSEPLISRPEQLHDILDKVRAAGNALSEDPGSVPIVALCGPGGFGKTTLAAEACRLLRSEFPDGVLWVSLGPHPSVRRLVSRCNDLVRLLGGQPDDFRDPRAAGDHLGRVLGNQKVLLGVDDVWRPRDLEPFIRGAPRTVRLVTTTVSSAVPRETPVVPVDQMSATETVALLGRGLPDRDVDWEDLVGRTGRWPLLAGIVNGAIRDLVDAHLPPSDAATQVSQRLAAGGPASLDPRREDQRNRAVGATVELTLSRLERRLGPEAVDNYRDLAILAGEDVPLDLLGTWRRLDVPHLTHFALQLKDLSLVSAFDAKGRTVRLHAVLREYLLSTEAGSSHRTRHASLLAAHRPRSGRWAALTGAAPYLWRWLVLHLHEAGLEEEAVATLHDVAFLSRAVELVGVSALLDQFDEAQAPDVEGLREWARRWSYLLAGLTSAEDVATTLLSRPGATTFLAWTNDGPVLPALWYADGWSCPEPAGTALEQVLGRDQPRVNALAWHPDGLRLAAGDGDGRVRIWRPWDTSEAKLVPCQAWVRAAAWSPDGQWLMCGDDEGGLHLVDVHLLDVDGPMESVEVGRQPSGVRAVAWHPSGGCVATAGDAGARVWTAQGELPDASWNTHVVCDADWVRSVSWSHTGRLLAVGDDGGAVTVWTLGDSTPVVLGQHQHEVFAVAWSARDEVLASCGADGVLALWGPGRGFPRRDVGHLPGPLLGVSWSPDSDHVVTGAAEGPVRVWGVDAGSEPVELGRHDGGALAVAWHPTRAEIASGGGDGGIRLWRLDGHHGALDLRGPADRIAALAWSASGRYVATVAGDGSVSVYPDSGAEPLMRLGPHVEACPAVAWVGDRVVTGSHDGTVRVWTLGSADVPAVETVAAGRGVRALVGSPDGTQLACVGADGSLQVWRMDEKAASVVLTRRGETARSAVWSADGRLIVTGDDDGALRAWTLDKRARPQVTPAHQSPVLCVAWSPDSRWLVSGDDAGTLRLLDVTLGHGRDVGRHDDAVRAADFSSDGAGLLSLSCDGRLRLWRTADGIEGPEPASTTALAGTSCCAAWRPTDGLLAVGGSQGLYMFQVRDMAVAGSP
ncbi:MAG: DUF4062 domain-containing protein [Dermatophilaceae bacterium]